MEMRASMRMRLLQNVQGRRYSNGGMAIRELDGVMFVGHHSMNIAARYACK